MKPISSFFHGREDSLCDVIGSILICGANLMHKKQYSTSFYISDNIMPIDDTFISY